MKSLRSNPLRARLQIFGALLAIGIPGCFTEIGNPETEISMTATMRVDPTVADSAGLGPESVEITRLRLAFLGADYRGQDSATGDLWKPADFGNEIVDFTADESLPRIGLSRHPREMTVQLGADPDESFVEGTFTRNDETHAFRFTLPDTSEVVLRYGSAALEAWRAGNEYRCVVAFLPRIWLALEGLDSATVATDTVIYFDPERNSELHEALVHRFFRAFNGEHAYPKEASP